MTSLTLGFLLALTLPAFGQPSQPPRTLAGMRGRYRPVLIFAPPGDASLGKQLDVLTAHRSDLLERQIMLVPVQRMAGGVAGGMDTALVTFLNGDEAVLRRRFHIPAEEFTVILLGKDGGEKFRARGPVTMDLLNGIIDAMPMRQAEMQNTRPH